LTLYDILLSADQDALKADIISACIGLGLCMICFAIEVPLAKVPKSCLCSVQPLTSERKDELLFIFFISLYKLYVVSCCLVHNKQINK